MKKNFRVIVYLMIVVVAAGCVYLWSQRGSGEEILDGHEPDSYDIEATLEEIDGNNLICNSGNDMFLFLDGTKVYLRESNMEIKANGDEVTDVKYKEFSFEELEEELSEEETVPIYLWLTQNGKVKTIMASRESFENHNASLAALEGLDPYSHTASNVILSMNKTGMKLAPTGYTEEEKDKFADLISAYHFAKDVRFYRGKVTITVDSDGTRHRNIQYAKDSYASVRGRIGQGLSAHIWVNRFGNVYAVLIHEEEIILN